jgi:protein-S-isoprenylcysteine O-methyltransferase Ste14
MSEEKGAFGGILKFLFSFLFEKISKEIDAKIKSYVSDIVRSMMRKIILGIIGAILILIGVVFVCISLVKLLSVYMPNWAAWLIIGLAVLIIGVLISMSMLKKEEKT